MLSVSLGRRAAAGCRAQQRASCTAACGTPSWLTKAASCPARAGVHRLRALQLEARVAHRQRLVDHDHVGVDVHRDREREPHDHAGGIRPDRLLEEIADLGERHDGVVALADLRLGQSQDRGVEEHVLAARELRVEAAAELQEGRHAPVHLHRARGGRQRPAHHLQQRGLARPLRPRCQRGAPRHFEAHVAQRQNSR